MPNLPAKTIRLHLLLTKANAILGNRISTRHTRETRLAIFDFVNELLTNARIYEGFTELCPDEDDSYIQFHIPKHLIPAPTKQEESHE